MNQASMAAPNALPDGDVGVVKPIEIQGIPSVAHLSTGLYCPLCRGVMKDAVLASKCCFLSFCDKCIRHHIISNSLCICGATYVLADDFLPNKTLRDTIVWFLESSNCCGANAGGTAFQPKGTDSASFLQPKSQGNAKVEEMAELVEVDNVTPKTLGEATVVGNAAEESKAPKTSIKQKQYLERTSGGNMEVSRDTSSNRKMTGKEDVPSVKSKCMSITPPECSTYDPEFICKSAKRKVKHDDDDYYEERSYHLLKKVRLHHHRSELVSATRLPVLYNTVDLPSLPSQSSTKKTTSDWKHKASVLARITFPEGESVVFKKRMLGSSSPAVIASSHHKSHRMTSKKYHEVHRNTATAVSKNGYNYYADHQDYELRDDDRQFKRRPSRYGSSPTPALKEGRHSSRGWRKKGVTAASIGGLSVY